MESRRRAQVVDVQKESTKTKYTSLAMKFFGNFLSVLRTCASIVISISGIGSLHTYDCKASIKAKTNLATPSFNNL